MGLAPPGEGVPPDGPDAKAPTAGTVDGLRTQGASSEPDTLSRLAYELRGEIPDLWFWFLSGIPGSTGVFIRSRFFGRMFARCGKQNVFQSRMRVTNPHKLVVGNHCNIAQGVYINAGGGVTLGDWVGIGPDAKIWSVNHRFDDPDTPWIKQGYELKEVVVEDDVWIGANAFVKPGVRIGRGAIISAGTVISKSVPEYAIVAGNPGRVVGWRKPPAGAAAGAPAENPS